MPSSEGTQQGDCCGPLFFSITLSRLLCACCPQGDHTWNRWYLDDGFLCGKTAIVEKMFLDLVRRAPELGLTVNVSKCKQWGPAPSASAVAPAVPWTSGVKVLGVPVGSSEFIGGVTTKTLAKLDACFQRLKMLTCALSAFHVLRSCLSACKVMFLLRTLPFEIAEVLASQTQSRVASAFSSVLGQTLEPPQWALACLPAKKGGLGLLDPRTVLSAAHAAAFLKSSVGATHSIYPSARCSSPSSTPSSSWSCLARALPVPYVF